MQFTYDETAVLLVAVTCKVHYASRDFGTRLAQGRRQGASRLPKPWFKQSEK